MDAAITYPDWQKTIREAQAKAEAREVERIAKEADERQQRNTREMNNFRETLAKCGLSGGVEYTDPKPEDFWDLPQITFGDYTFFPGRYGSIHVSRAVPNAEEKHDHISGYLTRVYGDCYDSAEGIAVGIDEIDQRATKQEQKNVQTVSDYEAYQSREKKVDEMLVQEDVPAINEPEPAHYVLFSSYDIRNIAEWMNDQFAMGYKLHTWSVGADEEHNLYTCVMELAEVKL